MLGFTLERFVNEVNGVWQEVVVCDGTRLILWHGEDVAARRRSARLDDVVAADRAAVRGDRGRLPAPAASGPRAGRSRVDSADVYLLLSSLDEAGFGSIEDANTVIRHDALRFGKTLDDGGAGQIARLEEFARLIASLVGRPLM